MAHTNERACGWSHTWRSAALVAVGVLLVAAGAVLAPAAGAATAESAELGMPFKGQWAYNAIVGPPFNDVSSSHPSVHAIYGTSVDWGTDLYAAPGTPVRLQVKNPTGALSFSWRATSTSCGTSTGVNIHVDGQFVGWIYYAHLNGAVRSGPISNGMTLGTVTGEGCIPAPHVHLEVSADDGNWACWTDKGNAGVTVESNSTIGRLGRTGATTLRAKCPAAAGGNPFGAFDLASSPAPGQVRARGWSADPDAPTSPTSVHIYVGGRAGTAGAEGHAITANGSRPDVGKVYPGYGNSHGFDAVFDTKKTGNVEVCAYAINRGVGSNQLLGCKTARVASPHPFGHLDIVSSPAGGQMRARGWAADPNAPTKPISVHIYVGGRSNTKGAEGHAIIAGGSRPDVGRAHPGYGDTHGFDATFTTSKRGTVEVCAYAIDTGPGDNQLLGCKAVNVAAAVVK